MQTVASGCAGAGRTEESIWELCSRLGVRLTARRREIVELIEEASCPIDVETIWRRLDRPGVHLNRASIYRALRYLGRHGAVSSHTVGRRQVFRNATAPAVLQLVDVATGRALQPDLEPLGEELRAFLQTRGFKLQGHAELRLARATQRSSAPAVD
jgi:Fe2+ or Zn2+ uptake regulation protein